MNRTLMILTICLLRPAMAGAQQPMAGRFHLTLDLHKVKSRPGKIYFWYDRFEGTEKVIRVDSALVKNAHVEFSGTVNEPQEAFLSTKPRLGKERVYEGDRLSFYLTAGEIKIEPVDSLNTYEQTGGYFRQDYQDFRHIKSVYDHKIIALAMRGSQAEKEKSPMQATKEFNDMVTFYADTICHDWALQHPASPVSLLPLRWYAGSVITNARGVDAVYNCLTEDVKKLPSAADLKTRIDNVLRSAVGNPAPVFTLPDTAGRPMSLASYRGKYVLLDFWASWCGPCRRENPNVVANFNNHRGQRFIVIGVSLDSESGKDAWLKAIRHDGLDQWPNLSDLKGFNNTAALLYGVQAVPQNFLIGPDGTIIAKNLFGIELTKKLEEVVGDNHIFKIRGSIGRLDSPAKAWLNYKSQDGWQMDSTFIINGRFDFSGAVPGDPQATLFINQSGDGIRSINTVSIRLYLEPGDISVSSPDSAANASVAGGPLNTDNAKLNRELAPVAEQVHHLVQDLRGASDEKRKSREFKEGIERRRDSINSQQNRAWYAFIRNNPASLVSLFALQNYAVSLSDADAIDSLYNMLSEQVRSTKPGVDYGAEIARMKSTGIGSLAPDFTLPDTSGRAVALHDFRGQYVLLDFWASWCGPCRAENPNVRAAFEAYHARGFTVVGVSLDQATAKDKWLKAIHDDHLTWTQLSDLQSWNNAAALLYSIKAIPQNFLIGPDGKIIGKNLRGAALMEKLATTIKQ